MRKIEMREFGVFVFELALDLFDALAGFDCGRTGDCANQSIWTEFFAIAARWCHHVGSIW
ncbi:hypothetical protein [Pseudomonas prosekii]|uniref:hypothetical protein n=1 Tax=Pseudomonas prosekii TaxID=1148509 RepID=UPI003F74E321